jgi:CubicO group peptidase (beta-lactamase class C family)
MMMITNPEEKLFNLFLTRIIADKMLMKLKYLIMFSIVSGSLIFITCEDNILLKEPGYFPIANSDIWEEKDINNLGWNQDSFEKTLDFVRETNTDAFIILHDGYIVHEEYGSWVRKNTRLKIASISKSIMAVLIGLAQENGFLNINDPVSDYLPQGWSKASPEQETMISIRNLMTMTSGLTDLLYYENEPGVEWRYNTAAFFNLYSVILNSTGMPIDEFAENYLYSKIGMRNAMQWYKNEDATARDLARLGLLLINNGDWESKVVVNNKGYLKKMLSPSAVFNPWYGFLWWLNQPFDGEMFGSPGEELKIINNAPDDLIAAFGYGNQKLYIIPSMNIVIVRLEIREDVQTIVPVDFDEEFWEFFKDVVK